MWTRREVMVAGAAAGASLALPRTSSAAMAPLDASTFPALAAQGDMPWLGLATSLESEQRYPAVVEGRIPAGLRGTLYRNGPGRFERAGLRKRCVLDGDGMLQRFEITDDGVTYENRFTRTDKFVEEDAADAFRYATWTTLAPGGTFSNLFARALRNQAGVSVVRRGDRLYAFDESNQPYTVEADSFETLGEANLPGAGIFSAHPKLDPVTGDWLHFGLGYGRKATAHLTRLAPDGSLAEQRSVELPRYVYLHDWFATERHYVLNLHPAPVHIFRFLFARTSLAGSFGWEPEQGNLLLVLPREGDAAPVPIETNASWMWHSLNAYERGGAGEGGGEIVADFVGYDAPDDFIGDDPALWAVMRGELGRSSPGSLRRYTIDVAARRVREETLADGAPEFPIVDPRRSLRPHRFGYVARSGAEPSPFWTQVARVDTESGGVEAFDFGERAYCGEPIFAPDPDRAGAGAGAAGDAASQPHREAGWLLSQVYDGDTRKSYLAILDAEHVADGPVARIHLRHHVPLSFHGYWHARA